MLTITIPEKEFYDETNQEFITIKSETIQLEHSLVSLSKWEAEWCKPFLGKDEKTTEETIDYIRCMTITQNVSQEFYNNLSRSIVNEIADYVNAPMTATWFNEQETAKKSREVITAEIIYYWLIAQNIPMECQHWHLNRLLTLIRVCTLKNQPPPKKGGRRDTISRQRALNESRRTQLNTKG
ncbi:hypothetical protein AGMMS49975_13590 [Clostridia bacterium]|nr:hypothetical protein AGMMS49975_13590 [Clostridia bacterium]